MFLHWKCSVVYFPDFLPCILSGDYVILPRSGVRIWWGPPDLHKRTKRFPTIRKSSAALSSAASLSHSLYPWARRCSQVSEIIFDFTSYRKISHSRSCKIGIRVLQLLFYLANISAALLASHLPNFKAMYRHFNIQSHGMVSWDLTMRHLLDVESTSQQMMTWRVIIVSIGLWFGLGLCPDQAVSHYLNQWWPSPTMDKIIRADPRVVPSQWETSLQSNAVSHWLGANLESALDHGPNPVELLITGIEKNWNFNFDNATNRGFNRSLVSKLEQSAVSSHVDYDLINCYRKGPLVSVTVNHPSIGFIWIPVDVNLCASGVKWDTQNSVYPKISNISHTPIPKN